MRLFRKNLLIYIFLLLLLSTQFAWTQEYGKPFIENYPAKLYHADIQNWSVVQDRRGVLYFANDRGVLEYDGRAWNLILTNNNSAVRSLSVDDDGIVYVGASGEFGYLAPDSLGRMQFVSLKTLLGDQDISFEDVWSTHATSDKVYFQTDYIVFQYDLKTHQIDLWHASEDSYFFLSFLVDNTLYLQDLNQGLKVVENNRLKFAPGGEELKGKRVYVMLPYEGNCILLNTRQEGLFIYCPDSASLEPFESEVNAYLLANQLYSGQVLKNGDIALCTRQGGLVVINPEGKLVNIVDKEDGLLDNNVRYVYEGYDQVLWLALDDGISQVNLNSPIRYWDESLGIEGNIRDILEFQGVLYVATSLGVYYLEEGVFNKISGISTECWSLLSFKDPEQEDVSYLLVGTNDGIYLINKLQAFLIKPTRPSAVLSLYQSYHYPSLLYAGLKGGILKLKFDQGTWQDQESIANIGDEIYSIAEDEKRNLWLGTFIKGVIRIQFYTQGNRVTRFSERDGLPTLRDIHIYRFEDHLLFATQKGLFRYNPKAHNFIPEKMLGEQFIDGSQGIYRLAIDQSKNIWVADISNQRHPIGMAMKRKNGIYRWQDTPLRRLPEFNQPVIYPAKEGIIWIGGSEGLFRYDSKSPKTYDYEFYNLMRKAVYREDSIVLWGSFYLPADSIHPRRVTQTQPDVMIPVFNYSPDFSMNFEYTAPFFDDETANEYSHYLEKKGQGDWLWFGGTSAKKWSIWSKDTKQQYTNLNEGTYIFYVKSRNVYGVEGKTAKFEFKILPPWYRTIYAYIFYALLFILLIYLTIKFYTARLRRQKRILEETVAMRTREIREQNKVLEQQRAEIAEQAEHLQEANEEITASINYASRIQGAMLLPEEKLKESFTDLFVLFKPRDIVSGDFYWFAETLLEPRYVKDPNLRGTPSIFQGFTEGKKIIAAVDCTGHGVPGAFMSMMGDAYLNQIINEEGITQPELILKALHDNIRYALNQDETENLDGMDMALCVFNPNYSTIEFAGAKNPLIYIQRGELHQINGDKFGIAGFKMDDSETAFTRHVIPLDTPTTIYLFSDGFADQFGGKKGRKFMIKRMRQLFLENYQKPMAEQKEILLKAHEDWKADFEQIDDILVLGIHIDPQNYR